MSRFNCMTEGLPKRIPESLDDACDALIIAHWLTDMLATVFKNYEDRGSFAHVYKVDADENPHCHNFIELFVCTHQLREYLPPVPEGHFQFEIYRDIGKPAVWYGNLLSMALVQLVLCDTEQALRDNWNNFFKIGAFT